MGADSLVFLVFKFNRYAEIQIRQHFYICQAASNARCSTSKIPKTTEHIFHLPNNHVGFHKMYIFVSVSRFVESFVILIIKLHKKSPDMNSPSHKNSLCSTSVRAERVFCI